MSTVFSISLPRRASTVSVARDVLGTLLRRSGLCEGCVDDILLSVSEACANAVEHGGPADGYEVDAELASDWCELRISHAGRAPDTTALARRFASERPPMSGVETETGRGILMMRCLMDEVAFSGEPRTTVILRKRLTACDTDEDLSLNGRIPRARFALL